MMLRRLEVVVRDASGGPPELEGVLLTVRHGERLRREPESAPIASCEGSITLHDDMLDGDRLTIDVPLGEGCRRPPGWTVGVLTLTLTHPDGRDLASVQADSPPQLQPLDTPPLATRAARPVAPSRALPAPRGSEAPVASTSEPAHSPAPPPGGGTAHCVASADALRVCLDGSGASPATLELQCRPFPVEPGPCPERVAGLPSIGTCRLPSGLRWVYYEGDGVTEADIERMCRGLGTLLETSGARLPGLTR